MVEPPPKGPGTFPALCSLSVGSYGSQSLRAPQAASQGPFPPPNFNSRPHPSGTQPLSVEASLALTCIPGWGVTLLGLAQPPLIPGVCKVDEEDQLDEDEEEGAHDAKVEPDCEERAMGWVVGP